MSITVRYFAHLREQLGQGELSCTTQADETAIELWQRLNKQALPENVLIAVNQNHVKGNTVINDGDEVAYFPPMTGG